MSVAFITAGGPTWASSRLRAYWPAAYLDAAQVVTIQAARDHGVPAADVVVFQKSWQDDVRASLPAGTRVVWDICDPVWWFDPALVASLLPQVDAVTVATPALATDLYEWMTDRKLPARPIEVISDCYEPAHFTRQAEHAGRHLRFVWYGIYANRVALHAAQANLERLAADGYDVSLTVIDNAPDVELVFLTSVKFPVYHARWSLDRENVMLAEHNVALLPAYPGPWGRMKSINRSVTAWACGLPVVSGLDYDQMARLADPDERLRFARIGESMLPGYTAEFVAAAWAGLLRGVVDGRL